VGRRAKNSTSIDEERKIEGLTEGRRGRGTSAGAAGFFLGAYFQALIFRPSRAEPVSP